MPLPLITLDELRDKIARGDRFHLFEVLAPMYFRKHHLPGARNLPPSEVRERIVELAPDRDEEIVLYCWDEDCPTSGWAGMELLEMGYTRVVEFPAGKKGWQAAGLELVKD